MKTFKKSKKQIREIYDVKEIRDCIEKAEGIKKELLRQNMFSLYSM